MPPLEGEQTRFVPTCPESSDGLSELKQENLVPVQRELTDFASNMPHLEMQVGIVHHQCDGIDEISHKSGPAVESPFLSLPREIRDLIYDAALSEHSYTFGDGIHDIRIVASNIALGAALAVNHQFRLEYDERAQVLSTLTISDIKYCEASIAEIKLPAATSRISALHFNLSALIKHPMLVHQEFDGAYHSKLISKIVDLIPNYRALSIRVELPWEETIAKVHETLQSQAWSALPRMKSLKAYQTSKIEPGSKGKRLALFDYGPPQNLVLEWSAESGRVESVKRVVELQPPRAMEPAKPQTNEDGDMDEAL